MFPSGDRDRFHLARQTLDQRLRFLSPQPIIAAAVQLGVEKGAQDDGEEAAAGAGERAQERRRARRLGDDVLPIGRDRGKNCERGKQRKSDDQRHHARQSDPGA